MKTIHVLALHLAYGGVEKAISSIANALAEKGYQIKIYAMYDMPDAPAYKLHPSIQVVYLQTDIPNRDVFLECLHQRKLCKVIKEGLKSFLILYRKKQRMKEVIKTIEDGVVISTRNEDSVLLSKYGHKNVLKIAQLHHDHNFDKKLTNDFKKHYLNINAFVLLTKQLQDEVEGMLKGYNENTKCYTIPNFLDEIPLPCNVQDKSKIALAVGRLHKVKGFDRLIKIFIHLHESQPEWKLQIVGDGEEYDALNRCILEANASSYIQLCGRKSGIEIKEMMQTASLYMMTSYSEGLPFVLLEAMSCMLPTIAYDVRVGPRAVIENDTNGYLINDCDESQFIEKALEIMSDVNLREKMSLAAYEKVNKYSKEYVIQQWIQLIENGVDL